MIPFPPFLLLFIRRWSRSSAQRPLRAPVTGLGAAPLGCCSYSPSPASAGIPSSLRKPNLQLYIPGAVGEPSRHTHSQTRKTARYSAGLELSGGWSTINVLIAVNKEINNERRERAWRNTSSLVFFLLKHYSPIPSSCNVRERFISYFCGILFCRIYDNSFYCRQTHTARVSIQHEFMFKMGKKNNKNHNSNKNVLQLTIF